MPEPESAPQSTVHEQDAEETGHAQGWRARTQDSVSSPSAKVIDLTQRHRDRIAERWGKPIEEPPPDPAPEPGEPVRLRDGLNQIHYWRDRPPSLRAIWADMRDGGADVHRDFGTLAFVAYWAVGIPAFAWVSACRIAEGPGHRPGRAAGAVLLLFVLWMALALAGLNPIPPSALNPF